MSYSVYKMRVLRKTTRSDPSKVEKTSKTILIDRKKLDSITPAKEDNDALDLLPDTPIWRYVSLFVSLSLSLSHSPQQSLPASLHIASLVMLRSTQAVPRTSNGSGLRRACLRKKRPGSKDAKRWF